jgi:hypothetical protein
VSTISRVVETEPSAWSNAVTCSVNGASFPSAARASPASGSATDFASPAANSRSAWPLPIAWPPRSTSAHCTFTVRGACSEEFWIVAEALAAGCHRCAGSS